MNVLPRVLLPGRGFAASLVAAGLLMGSASDSGAVDKFAAEFLKIGVGARALGMGGAFVSIADDATAAYWNPAGLVHLDSREAFGMHASQFGGILAHDVLGISTPIGGPNGNAAVAITVIRLAVDDIKVTKDAKTGEDENGNPILDPSRIHSESASDLALLLSYGRGFGDRWAAGLNVKVVRQSLVDEGASFGIGADLGFHYRPSPGLAFGLRLSDITTTQLFWDTGRREAVSPTVALGAHTTQHLDALQGTLTLGVNLDFGFENLEGDQFNSGSLSGNVLPGMEYWFRDAVAVRFGSDAGDFTAGAGVRYKQFGADYAYLSHDELDGTHRVSALLRF